MSNYGPTEATRLHWAQERMKRGKLLLETQRRLDSGRLGKSLHRLETNTGKMIEGLRMFHGLSQRELAALVECTQKHISILERSNFANTKMLERVAKGVGATLRMEFIP
jgi:hypothetical protein